MAFDTIIKGGKVVDGSGLPMRTADVGIKAGRITDVGHLSGANQTIDADGLMVIPGIIDAHTHYDPQLAFEPLHVAAHRHGGHSELAGGLREASHGSDPHERRYAPDTIHALRLRIIK